MVCRSTPTTQGDHHVRRQHQGAIATTLHRPPNNAAVPVAVRPRATGLLSTVLSAIAWAAIAGTLIFLAGCADIRPDTIVSPELESGITSNNGGGARALGNIPNVGVTTRVSP